MAPSLRVNSASLLSPRARSAASRGAAGRDEVASLPNERAVAGANLFGVVPSNSAARNDRRNVGAVAAGVLRMLVHHQRAPDDVPHLTAAAGSARGAGETHAALARVRARLNSGVQRAVQELGAAILIRQQRADHSR